jgi:hypothetical protein
MLVFVLVAVWLFLPVYSEAGNQGRTRLCVALVLLCLLSLISALSVRGQQRYAYDPEIVAHDPDGTGRQRHGARPRPPGRWGRSG